VVGRRRAVSVALFVAAIVVSIIPAAATSATAPPGLERFLYALGEVESGGNYYALNAVSGAYGKYQIIPSNWPGWAKLYIGSSTAPQTPANQERVAHGKVTALYGWLDTWPNVAHWWLTGSGERNQALWSSYSKTYVAKIMTIYNATPDIAAAPPPKGVVVITTQRVQESNAAIDYSGRWRPANHTAYAKQRVLYASTNGATATYSFKGRSITWVGPVGQTRGKARVYLDGKLVGTVDTRRSAFKPRVTLFSRSWANVGSHTLTIQVIGSGRPVAIDEFVTTR
jgi:hypothetical protein